MVLGELPNISSSAISIGVSPLVLEENVNLLLPVTSPTVYIGERSLSAIF